MKSLKIKRLVAITTVLAFVMIASLITPKNIYADDVIEPDYQLMPNQVVGRIDDTVSIKVSGLDFRAPTGDAISDYNLKFVSELDIQSLELQSIEIPYMYGYDKDGNKVDTIGVYFMAFTDMGRDWLGEPAMISNGDIGFKHVFNRSEMLDVINANNFGEFPSSMWLRFVGENPDPNGAPIYLADFHMEGDIVFNYKVVDKSQYFVNGHSYFQPILEHRYQSEYDAGVNQLHQNRKYAYVYHENSEVVIHSEKTEDLIPGEEVTLNFDITNTATNLNNNLTLYLKAEGIEPLPTGNPNISWEKYNEGWYLNIKGDDGKKLLLTPGETKSLALPFKINDDYQGSEIVLTPGLSPYEKSESISYDSSVTLFLQSNPSQPVEPIDPTKPIQPVEPNKPMQPAEVVKAPSTGLVENSYSHYILLLIGGFACIVGSIKRMKYHK